jgi:glycine dehydrogenase subunit 1
VSRYTAVTPRDLEAMLAVIGVSSVQELFDRQIPDAVRLREPLELGDGMGEQEAYVHLRALAQRNVSTEQELSFLGAGMYDNYVPAIVDMLCERSEFLTPYTPYQPEVSQGSLQVMFEYQTAISELTALPVANASVYEGPSALASAAYMAKLHNRRARFVVSAGVHPHSLQTLRTYARGFDAEVVEVPLVGPQPAAGDPREAAGGRTDIARWRAAIDDDTCAAIFAQPNFYGVVEDAPALCAAAKGAAAATASAPNGPGAAQSGADAPVVIAQVDPITLGVLAPPGACGVDVAVGEGQGLGGRLDFGGPSFGLFAAREQFVRRMPGRIAGETRDVDGRRGFVLTLQTREQHIRREKATSNICTAQALNALAATVYLSWLGRHGLVALGELLIARTQYARRTLTALDGVSLLHDAPVVRELALHLDCDIAALRRECARHGVNPGADLQAITGRAQDRGGLLVAITEQRTREDIDRLAVVLKGALSSQRPPSDTNAALSSHRRPVPA